MIYRSLLFLVISATAAIVVRADSAFSLQDWARLDPQTKLSVTRIFIEMEETKGHVTMKLSPEYYVHELDVVVEALVRKGDTEGLKSSVGRSTKTIAMMDCDWDDGAADRFVSAQKFFGPAMLENIKQLYPQKYERIRNGCK